MIQLLQSRGCSDQGFQLVVEEVSVGVCEWYCSQYSIRQRQKYPDDVRPLRTSLKEDLPLVSVTLGSTHLFTHCQWVQFQSHLISCTLIMWHCNMIGVISGSCVSKYSQVLQVSWSHTRWSLKADNIRERFLVLGDNKSFFATGEQLLEYTPYQCLLSSFVKNLLKNWTTLNRTKT